VKVRIINGSSDWDQILQTLRGHLWWWSWAWSDALKARPGWVLVAASLGYQEKSCNYNGWMETIGPFLTQFFFLLPVSIYLSLCGSLPKRCYFHKLALRTSHWHLIILLALLLATSSTCFPCHSVTFSLYWPIPISSWCIFLVHQSLLACPCPWVSITCSINNFCVLLGPAFLSWQLPQKPWAASGTGLLPRFGVSFSGPCLDFRKLPLSLLVFHFDSPSYH
jgi:hypothetical protein